MAGYYLEGQRFGRLVVKRFYGYSKSGKKKWLCVCDCGKETVVDSHKLVIGHTKSCGCLHKDLLIERLTTHGGTNERLYGVWWDAKRRCERPYDKNYDCYGGRGIKLCKEWHDYSKFREWALANGYEESAKVQDCTLDRINVNGDYCPDNCRWIPMSEQRYNCRNTVYVQLDGKQYTLKQLSEMFGIPRDILYKRIVVYEWTAERATNTPYEKKTA